MQKPSTPFKFIDQPTNIERVLYAKTIDRNLPSVVIFAGIHGNEPAGVIALKKVIDSLEKNQTTLKGNFYAIAGNLDALKKNIRYNISDLNRLWTKEDLASLNGSKKSLDLDRKEQYDLYQLIKELLSKNKGPFYFIDLHTTSADTIPFITISDSLNNRKFANNFSVPIVLGIEEYLEGPLLTFINEFGHVSLGFEAGQHHDAQAIHNCESFIWQTLNLTKCIAGNLQQNETIAKELLNKYIGHKAFFEIAAIHRVREHDNFMMLPNFKNFEKINARQVLALNRDLEITASINGYIFMPLYQKQGNEGFFIITKISTFWLQLSKLVRRLKLHNLLRVLPGIKQDATHKHTLIVNPKTAAFLAVPIFHLFGYRKKIRKGNKLHFIRRDRKITHFS